MLCLVVSNMWCGDGNRCCGDLVDIVRSVEQ